MARLSNEASYMYLVKTVTGQIQGTQSEAARATMLAKGGAHRHLDLARCDAEPRRTQRSRARLVRFQVTSCNPDDDYQRRRLHSVRSTAASAAGREHPSVKFSHAYARTDVRHWMSFGSGMIESSEAGKEFHVGETAGLKGWLACGVRCVKMRACARALDVS
ncbi:hypothetical protein L227DRAFT_192368 [Lentinus tigrinus ALCF2SS1-6]|uniref:Uncharacterized protein n=1 Tax=Lentinus tigrinus ALCF2SS1-6 TaxID=1328759 RepID=A0A5C2S5I3_9APHY|nr:hypothetical protein L227DRAFT_192368 [Lentinus tigrinus ALCF2SS1-6]